MTPIYHTYPPQILVFVGILFLIILGPNKKKLFYELLISP